MKLHHYSFQYKKGKNMFNDKILKSVAEAVKAVVDEALKGDQHKIDKNKNGKVDAHDFKLLRKEEAKKPVSPFDWKNTPRQTAEKGEKTGHTAKKISTGTVYTKKYTKEEASQEEFNKEIKIAQDKSIGKSKAEVAKPAVQAVKQESVEQIDELKKSTLASYVKKASHDVAHKGALTRQFANDSAAAKKDSNYWDAKKADDKSNKMFAKSWKRRENMGKAVDRLAKEEVEQEVFESADDKHFSSQSKKMQDAINLHLRKGKSYKDAVLAAKVHVKEEVEHIEERSLSTGEKAAMEKNVKGMKKNIAGFKERYGKDAKSVMYATATKQAKGE
jgi:hypothetical protein